MDKVRLGLCLAFVAALASAPDSALAASLPAWNNANSAEHARGRGGRAGAGAGVGVVAGCNIYEPNKFGVSTAIDRLTEPLLSMRNAPSKSDLLKAMQAIFFLGAIILFKISNSNSAF